MSQSSTANRLSDADDRVARGHIFAFAHPFARSQPAYFVNGAAGVITTANDMAQWLIVHANEDTAQNGEQVLSASGMQTMQRPNLNDYGLGWTIREQAAGPKVFHDGWAPAFTAYQVVFPKEHLGVVVLTNVGKTTATEYEPSAIAAQIVATYQGQRAISHGEDGINADLLLAAQAIIFSAGGFYCLLRAHPWAARFCDSRDGV
jgi:CubicO group peptidase (beta-lactamase class C family)